MLSDTIDEGVIVIDDAGTVEYANRAGMRMIGLRPNETGSAVLWKLVPDLGRSLNFLRGEDGLAPNIARDAEIFIPNIAGCACNSAGFPCRICPRDTSSFCATSRRIGNRPRK